MAHAPVSRMIMEEQTGMTTMDEHHFQGDAGGPLVHSTGGQECVLHQLEVACCSWPTTSTKKNGGHAHDIDNYHHKNQDSSHDEKEGTADDDDHSFMYLHYDRMCESATAAQDHSALDPCSRHVLPLLLPSLPGGPQHHDDSQEHHALPAAAIQVEHDTILQSFSSSSLRTNERISPIMPTQGHDCDPCLDDATDSEDSFDDEIYRLFGDTACYEEHQGGAIRTNTTVQSLKPRTTTTTTEASGVILDSSVVPSVTPDTMGNLTTTTRNIKLVSPSPQPVFVSSQESLLSAQFLVPLGGVTTSTSRDISTATIKREEDDFSSTYCQVSTEHHRLATNLPFLQQLPARNDDTFPTVSPNKQAKTHACTLLPKGVPMTPPPVLYTAYNSTLPTTTGNKPSATPTPRTLPFLMGKQASSSSPQVDPELVNKMHLISPLLPSCQVQRGASLLSRSSLVSPFLAHGTTANSTNDQDQAKKRLLFEEDKDLKRDQTTALAAAITKAFPHQETRKKKRRSPSLVDDDSRNDDTSISGRAMITIGPRTTSTNVLVEPSWQSPPRPSSKNKTAHYDSGPAGSSDQDGHGRGQEAVVIGDKKEESVVAPASAAVVAAGAGPSTPSSSSAKRASERRRLHFWDFQSRTWTARFREAQAFRLKNGHCRIPENYPENVALGRWAKRQRSQYKIRQRACLGSWGGEMEDDDMLMMILDKDKHHNQAGGSSTRTMMIAPDNGEQQDEGPRRMAIASSIMNGGIIARQVENRSGEGLLGGVNDYKGKGDCSTGKVTWLSPRRTVTTSASDTNGGGNEENINTEERHGNHYDSPAGDRGSSSACNPLTEERIRLLNSIDFVWDLQACGWFRRYDELVEFKLQHGHTDVPQKYPQNQRLSTWVRTQRRSCAKGCMTMDRIELLDRIGFDWENPSAKKKYKKPKY